MNPCEDDETVLIYPDQKLAVLRWKPQNGAEGFCVQVVAQEGTEIAETLENLCSDGLELEELLLDIAFFQPGPHRAALAADKPVGLWIWEGTYDYSRRGIDNEADRRGTWRQATYGERLSLTHDGRLAFDVTVSTQLEGRVLGLLAASDAWWSREELGGVLSGEATGIWMHRLFKKLEREELVEAMLVEVEDGSTRAWRITDKGRRWAAAHAKARV